MDYFTALKYCKKDLKKYSKKAILNLAKNRNINISLNYNDILTELSKDIINEYYKSSNLDYDDCTNNTDYINLELWSKENQPDIKIFFINNPNKKPEILCINKETINQLIAIPENKIRGWIPQDYKNIDKNGHGGRPSYMERFTKIIDKYIDNPEIFELNEKETLFSAIPVYKNKRVGKENTNFGISELHGQLPGETIYHIFTGPLTVNTAKNIYNEYYKNKLKKINQDQLPNELNDILEKILQFNQDNYYIDDNVKTINSDLNSIINYILSRNNTIILSKKDNDKYSYIGIDINPDLEEFKEYGSLKLITKDTFTDNDFNIIKKLYNNNKEFRQEIDYIYEHESENII